MHSVLGVLIDISKMRLKESILKLMEKDGCASFAEEFVNAKNASFYL